MELGYERIDHLVAISAAAKNSRLCSAHSVSTDDNVILYFSNYVKSQVHLNVSYDLYDRPLSEYIRALRFINGNKKYKACALKVLRYFYLDMYHFLVNNENDVKLRVVIDTEFDVPEMTFDYSEIRQKIVALVETGELVGSEVADIVDDCDSSVEIQRKMNSYVMIAILKKVCASENVCRLNVIGVEK